MIVALAIAAASPQVDAGIEGRLVYTRIANPDFGAAPPDPSGAFYVRASGWAAAAPTSWLRFRLRLDTAGQVGSAPSARPLDVDALHVQELVAELGDERVSLKVGRDIWKLGDGLLVDDRQGPNVRRGFDGAWLSIDTGAPRIDGFFGAEVQSRPGVLDNVPTAGNLLWGAHLEQDGWIEDTRHTLYYLGATREDVAYQAAAGAEIRHSLGTGWHGRTPRVHFDLDVLGQVGRVADERILAWGVAGEAGLPLDAPGHPTPFVAAGIASGDGPADGIGTFRAPYPQVRQLGAVAQLAPSNTAGVNLGLRLVPHPTVFVNAVVRGLWRTTTSDAIYAIPGFPSRITPTDDRFVGVGEGLVVLWTPHPALQAGAFFDAFHPGPVIQSSPPADDSWLLSFSLTLHTETKP